MHLQPLCMLLCFLLELYLSPELILQDIHQPMLVLATSGYDQIAYIAGKTNHPFTRPHRSDTETI